MAGEPVDWRDDPRVLATVNTLLADRRERAAVALFLMSFNTPEDVGIMLGQRRPEILTAWTGPGRRESDRHLWRRRAAVALGAYAGGFGLDSGATAGGGE